MCHTTQQQENYMKAALALAKAAQETGDVPVGCVIVQGDRIIGQGQNRREAVSDATAHAEVEAIRMACRALGRWNLSDCALYVTLEPCPMCAGAIWNARIPYVYFGARDPQAGCCGSVLHFGIEGFRPEAKIWGGLLEEESLVLLRDFFQGLRKNFSI